MTLRDYILLAALFGFTMAGSATDSVRTGTATYCAPTPTKCQNWGGDAHLGAMRSFRYGDKPYRVRVCHEGACTVVRVVSFCECARTLIDLSPAAFRELAPLSAGRISVTVERIASIPLPETDTDG